MNLALSRQPFWPYVWLLLRLRVQIMVRDFLRAKRGRKIGMIILALVIVGLIGFAFLASWWLLGFLNSPELAALTGDLDELLDSIPVLVMSAAFLGVMFTSFGVLLQVLYLSKDMDFLLAAPVPIRAVFVAKLLQAILPNLGIISILALPVLFGLGLAQGYSWLYYPLVIVLLCALALAAAGISSLLVIGIVRLFSARRVAEILGFLGAIMTMICSQSGQLARFDDMNADQAQAVIGLASRYNTPWMPLAWAGRGLVALGLGEWSSALFNLGVTLALSVLIFTVALITAERLYYTGWASMQTVPTRKKQNRKHAENNGTSRLSGASRLAGRFIPPAVSALMVKDYYVLRRDLRNLSQLITPLIFGVIYTFILLREPQSIYGRNEMPEFIAEAVKNLSLYINVGMSLFVSWLLVARLGGMGFAQEGKSFWMLKTAPLRVSQLVIAKFSVAYLPGLLLGWLFLVALAVLQQAALSVLWFTAPAVALIIAGNAGIQVTFGITGANLDWSDPRQMVRGSAGCLSSIVSLAFLPVAFSLFFLPPLGAVVLGLPEWIGQLVGLLLGGAFSLACAILPLSLVSKRVLLLGEAS